MEESIKFVLTILQLLLAFGNLAIMLWALKNFLKKPHDTLEQRVCSLEKKYEEIDDRLQKGDKKFLSIDKKAEVLIMCILALVDFEISYCIHTGYEDCDDLKACKKHLNEYISKN